MTDQKKLKRGKRKVKIGYEKCEYEGEVDDQEKACGKGKAKHEYGDVYEGTFYDGKLHGIGK